MNRKPLMMCVRAVAMLLVLALGLAPGALAETVQAENIRKLEGVKVDYTESLDSTKVFQLPDTIRNDQEISVIITVDGDTLLDAYEGTDKTLSFGQYAQQDSQAKQLRDSIQEKKAQTLAKLDEQGIAYKTGLDYSTLLSGFELVITARDYEAVCKSLDKGQKAIIGEEYSRMETELVENTVNVYETGIFDSANVAYDGSGMVVAVLDTGLDSNHSAFSVDNFTSEQLGMTYEDVAAVVSKSKAAEKYEGLSVDDVYINKKVPFGFDYADCDPDVYSTHNNHGTHVSGIIVGKDDTITGVAPNAQVVSMKIFSDVMDTARSAWILAALEDCVLLGVDVINMSIGTSAGFSREMDEVEMNEVYEKIRAAGISMVAAASNSYSSAYGSETNGNLPLTSNPDVGTVGSPGTYAGVLAVASISGTETPYLLHKDTIIYFDESNDGSSQENDFCATLLGDKQTMDIEYVIVPGVGRSADYTGMDVEGKIALVRRGDNTFEEKAIIAQSQGAAGIIIYNNVSGEIKMNVGDATLAACSISQDAGEMLVAAGNGKLKISKKQTSGPFISDFSSWGPTPSLQIKPEITGHGGNILSSVTGGGYDRISGTSMACPNLAGVVVLLRQYVVENFPDIANDGVKVNAMVNQLLMSTADIALNTNGLPYAVRKQGAGLANLNNAIETPAYIITEDADGKEMDKTKLELGDDPEKTGVYDMTFTVRNISNKTLRYALGSYVMTEGVSETKTNAGETTVTEAAYILSGAKTEIIAINGEEAKGTAVKVKGGEETEVTVRLTLGEADKKYLDDNFLNGMYVEGYLTLEAKSGTKIDMSIPYLAFYGDWTQAPLFDLEFYETNADELDDGLDEEDKLKADAYATRLIGGMTGDYVSYLGSYYFLMGDDDMKIPADKKYIALSNQNETIHSLRFAWAGLLRNAAGVKVTITNDATGETVFETEDVGVRKSYGDGGTPYPANVEIEFDTMDYNLPNNSTYTVTMEGTLDYGDGGVTTNEKNTYTFPLTVDFEAPTLSGVEFYTEYDKAKDETKLFAKAAIYDNHYAMSAQLGYVTMEADAEGNETATMKTFEQYMNPVYSQKNSTTYVTFELTDYLYQIKEGSLNPNSFAITCYDYALNYATYEVRLPDVYEDFYFEDLGEELTLSPNEVLALKPLVSPDTAWSELLEITSSKPSVVRVVNDKLVATASGTAWVKVRDPRTNQDITFKVTVLAEGDEGYRRYDKPVADVFELTGYYTVKAYYMLSSDEKLIGDTGDTRFFEGNYNLSMYPSESVMLQYKLSPYFPADTKVVFESSNENIVKITENGIVTANEEGFASVTVKVLMDDRSTYYSETVSVEVKDPYVTTGPSLTHYFGNGGTVVIPDRLNLTDIGSFAFSNFDYVDKTAEELAFDDAESTKQWYIGESTIAKVVIPEGVERINAYAFANLTALEEVVLPSTLEAIEYGAFYGCTSLKTITFSGENNLKIINQQAFENCALEGTVDLSAVCVIADYAFAGNKKLEGVTTSDSLLSIGQYAFAGCKELKTVTVTAKKVKYGPYAFTDCEALEEFYVNAAVLPEGMFSESRNLKKVTVGPDVNTIGAFAFRDTAVETLAVESGSAAYQSQSAGYILSSDGKTLAAVAPSYKGAFTAQEIGNAAVTAIGDSAFSHNTKITSVSLPQVVRVGNYAFAHSTNLEAVELGTLETVGEYAFFETAIQAMPQITEKTQLGRYCFSFTQLKEVVIPDGMTVPEGAFSECMALESVTVGNDAVLEKFAFSVDKDNSYHVLSYTIDPEDIILIPADNGALGVPEQEEQPEIPEEKEEPGATMEQDTQIEGSDKKDEEPKYVDQGKRFYYELRSPLTSLTIGSNATIGDNAFAGAACLETVTLGENAKIGYMSFYNNSKLKNIDLSKAASIGDYAFSGDVYYLCLDDAMTVAAVSAEGQYQYTYHAPALETVDLAAAATVGEFAFAYCRELKTVQLGEQLRELPQYIFAGCIALEEINTAAIVTVGDYAFNEAEKLPAIDLSAAETVGEYAFVYCDALASVKLNPNGTGMGEGAFAYCEALAAVENLAASKVIGDYAFAYTALVSADLTGAEDLGTAVFLKEELTPFAVTLGDKLKEVGDNPFAFCEVDLTRKETVSFNGKDSEKIITDYELTRDVFLKDGALYIRRAKGLELITFSKGDLDHYKVAEDTVRIAAMAFAGSGVKTVELPNTVTAIGHKAFYDCQDLEMVILGSQQAPVLEEEFDPSYYNNLEHVPGTGDFGTYTDYDGTEVTIEPMEIVPFFMWNATGGMYSNAFYGATFVDYVGAVEEKLLLIRPVNGVGYDSFIYGQYFDRFLNGPAAPDANTLAAIQAIKSLGSKVSYEDKDRVEAARTAYDRIATLEQKALVTNYADLISAEQRITALAPTEEGTEATEPTGEAPSEEAPKAGATGWIIALAVLVLGGGAAAVLIRKKGLPGKEKRTAEESSPEEESEEESEEEESEEAEAEEADEEESEEEETE